MCLWDCCVARLWVIELLPVYVWIGCCVVVSVCSWFLYVCMCLLFLLLWIIRIAGKMKFCLRSFVMCFLLSGIAWKSDFWLLVNYVVVCFRLFVSSVIVCIRVFFFRWGFFFFVSGGNSDFWNCCVPVPEFLIRSGSWVELRWAAASCVESFPSSWMFVSCVFYGWLIVG